MSPEEQFQLALDEMMKKYENSKISLEKFIENYPDNQLSGSAHIFGWEEFINLKKILEKQLLCLVRVFKNFQKV